MADTLQWDVTVKSHAPGPGVAPGRIEHIFSVDVEEYFQVSAFDPFVDRAAWGSMPSRVEESVDGLLALLARHGATATFFTLGCVAERHRGLVERIAAAGHEIASHGWSHRRASALTPKEFAAELTRSKALLEDVSGQEVVGFRAPSFSLRTRDDWAFDAMLEAGYRYDSSVFPIRRPGYGDPSAPTSPFRVKRPCGDVIELPPATLESLGWRIPAAGGGYLRHFPLALLREAVRRIESRGESAMLYVHPWEIDPAQPRLAAPALTRLRHYGGLHRTLPRLERLLTEFRFTSAARRYDAALRGEGRGGIDEHPRRAARLGASYA
jgi:polysaccharide deacetylase family protein (PEP-CTERM system associated)